MRTRFLIVLFAIGCVAVQTVTAQTAEPIPNWLAWRVYHEAITYNRQHGRMQEITRSLVAQFGITQGQAASLANEGEAYTKELERIDDDARKEVRKRYPDTVPPDKTHAKVEKTKPAGPQKSIKERAIADGLYAEVEGKKQAALNAHMAQLTRDIGATKLGQITQHVQTVIASKIHTFTVPAPGSPVNRGLPPGITKNDRLGVR